MRHISDLPNKVLELILFKAAATPSSRLHEWKYKLPLLAVCRVWTKLVIGAVFNHVYVEFATALRYHLDTHLLWTSNADLFISRGCMLMARRLTIEWEEMVTPACLQRIVLDILNLDRVDWQHINSLTFTSSLWTFNRFVEPVSQDKRAVTDIARTVQYFAQNLRNIVDLNWYDLRRGSTGRYLYTQLITYYGHQLQVLKAQGSTPLPISCFSRRMRVLDLTLDSSATRVLPSICGETLVALRLEDVPHNFAWHHFCYEKFTRPISFNRLTILYIGFEGRGKALTEGEIEDKTGLGAHNCDKLSFPMLKQLSIANCTPDCDLLYADIPFRELEKVHLSGPIFCICHCSRLKLTCVGHLDVNITPSDSGDTADIYRVTNHLFTDICIGRTASLRIIIDWFILDPELMRWVNLTTLDIGKVRYTTICRAIGQLPKLRQLTINRLEFSDMATHNSTVDLPLFTSADPMLIWGEKLATLLVRNFNKSYPLMDCVGGIQALILHAGAIKELVVPRLANQHMFTFIDMFKDKHPHLANLTVHR
ncbi:hypothetical protein IW146_001908 [Coemansia sp. RSA 922]|nr:hypothetical protein IW146_001908 [Coemansia sp. RSA 922]